MRHKKRVMVLGGNFDQVPYLVELRKRDYFIALTDKNPMAPGRVYADSYAAIAYDDVESLLRFARDLNLNSSDYVFSAAAQFSQVGAALVAEISGIQYPKVSTIEMCLDKRQFYPAFQRSGLPVPETRFIRSLAELEIARETMQDNLSYYLKSDFSKNPRYIYKFTKTSMSPNEYFWDRDRYLRETYILQKEFEGRHLRLNLFDDGYLLFDFHSNNLLDRQEVTKIFAANNILFQLKSFLATHGLGSWLIKFDLIVGDCGFVVLDIGLDPPYRMKNLIDDAGFNFAEMYVDQYLEGKVRYPIVSSHA